MSVDDSHTVAVGGVFGQDQDFQAVAAGRVVAIGGVEGGVVAPDLGFGVVGPGQAMRPVAEGDGKPGTGGNYKQVAEALGGWGTRVSKPEKIISALQEAISITESGKPALVEFITKENFDFSKYE